MRACVRAARAVSQHERLHSAPTSKVGTSYYIAPEVLVSETYDGKVRLPESRRGETDRLRSSSHPTPPSAIPAPPRPAASRRPRAAVRRPPVPCRTRTCTAHYSHHAQHEKFQSAPGSRVGTPAYLAPEVILTTKGKTYNGKVSALYSVLQQQHCCTAAAAAAAAGAGRRGGGRAA